MILLTTYVAITFRRKYRETKAWLYEHADAKQDGQEDKKPPNKE
jgi:hypothetical protein